MKAENDKLRAENEMLKTQLAEAISDAEDEERDLLQQIYSIRIFFNRFLGYELPDEALDENYHDDYEGEEEEEERVATPPRYEDEPPTYSE